MHHLIWVTEAKRIEFIYLNHSVGRHCVNPSDHVMAHCIFAFQPETSHNKFHFEDEGKVCLWGRTYTNRTFLTLTSATHLMFSTGSNGLNVCLQFISTLISHLKQTAEWTKSELNNLSTPVVITVAKLQRLQLKILCFFCNAQLRFF